MAKAKEPSAPLNLPAIAPPVTTVAATAPVAAAAKPSKPALPAASFQQFVCAATQQRVRTVTSGEWEQAEADLATHPVGWGRLIEVRVLPNPAVADHEAQRAALVQQAVEMTRALAESPTTPEAQRVMLMQQLSDGTTEAEAEAHFDQQHPAPDETVTLTIAWDVSPAGFAVVDDALRALGFNVPDPTGEAGE